MKIVGVGLNKTGTSTLKACCHYWGLKHATYDLEAFELYRERKWDRLNGLMDKYDSFENWPWALMYRQFDDRFPGAKFILTTRKDPQSWFRSLCNHSKRLGPLVDFEQYIYGFADPCRHKKEHLAFYRSHNAEVAEYFRDRPGKLLTACWESGDDWEELCAFLGRPIPETDFPHANKTPRLWDRFESAVRPRLGRVKQDLMRTFSEGR